MIQHLLGFLVNLNTAAGSRVYPGRLPDRVDNWPALTLTVVSTMPEPTHDGGASIFGGTIQATAWGQTYDQARALADLLVNQLAGYKGQVGGLTSATIFASNAPDLFDTEAKLFYVPIDLMVWHN